MVNTVCINVSNFFPFFSFGEYTKSWNTNLISQKTPIPKEIFLPKVISTNATLEAQQSNPIRKTSLNLRKKRLRFHINFIIIYLCRNNLIDEKNTFTLHFSD